MEKKEEPKEDIKVEPHNLSGFYIGYTARILISVILIIVLSVLGIMTIYSSFKVDDLVNIRYTEQSSIDYKVYLNENDFYSQEYLGKDMAYVANLVNKIVMDMNYHFKINKNGNLEFNYQVLADLLILDKNNPDKVFYQETYTLTEYQTETIRDYNDLSIQKEVSIDYGEYNTIANKFAKSYGVETTSYLDVYLVVKYKTTAKSPWKLQGEATPRIKIPLSEQSIKLEVENVDGEKRVNKRPTVHLDKPLQFCLGMIFALGAIGVLIYAALLMYKARDKKSLYDKTIEKILREYDRLIVDTTTPPPTKEKKVITIKSFNELLDVRDNIKEPIKYYIIHEHSKCQFYISHQDELYIMTIKEVDLEEEKQAEKKEL